MSRIIAIANEKGGSGKTTTAVNLGAFLAKFGKKVLLIDLDPQANATISLGFDPNNLTFSLYNVLSDEVNVEDVIHKTSLFNFDILPSHQDLAGINVEFLQKDKREDVLKNKLFSVKNYYDFILIDSPPSLAILTLNGLVAAQEVIIPIQCEFFSKFALSDILSIFNILKKNLDKNFNLIFGLLTMYDKRNRLSRQIVKEMRDSLPVTILNTIIPRNVKLAEAPQYGKTILQYDPGSKGARAYEMLAEEIINFKIY
ncbi:MAG: AAA family ATPase [Candidatus Pacebacteria bacterium]|nr:AAA family ATPase [Candidatus Paceibacterota bacterium]